MKPEDEDVLDGLLSHQKRDARPGSTADARGLVESRIAEALR